MHPQKKIKIALTGGIGTGKTYISKHFLDRGIPVFYADEEAKKLYFSEKVLRFLKNQYEDLLFSHNQLDFSKLAAFIFSDKKHQKEIEAFIHPLVMKRFEEWSAEQTSSIVILESAIVFEAGFERFFDKIIVVDAPFDIRIQRIKNRDTQLTEEEILQRVNSQMPQKEKCRRADLVIWNG